ncbi:LIM domain only protein 7 isoform X4 [Pundamilia nyererei]|uniref:LIM domain only protein 7 isoform X4 n=1 Tax=Pundamilia nyererei TaxID=303518 RepID=A0A9Y6JB32_9CICH|nr:PREDICTED: LIM domain only protein 7 isoform X4 [Pundamilia nyererei]
MMEWREQSSVSCEEAYSEAQRWIEAVTKKKFGSKDFRSALENGVLLCELINKIKPGVVKRVNRLPTPIAGLDNLNVFLKACGKLGLKEAQLFHPGDLQDLSSRVTVKDQETSRRLKNVLITIYWLGRRAQCDCFYDGPYLNFKAFEGLLGTALYKALQDSSSQKSSNVRDSGFGDNWYSEREELSHLRGGGGGGGGGRHRRDDSLDSLDSLGSRPHSISSDTTLKGSSEGCCSDTEADSVFKMTENKDNLSYRRSAVVAPKTTTQFNQFLPTKDKASGYVPAPLRKKRAERNEDNRRSWASSSFAEDESSLTRERQEGTDGSKSTSDVHVDPAVIRQVRYEELQKYREKVKQSEDKWQDALSDWKSRRRSVNSDIVKKKEEREKIEQITYGGEKRSKTFKEMQEEREGKRKSSVGSRLGSLSFLDDDDDNVFEKPVIAPRTRALPSRSYTIDTSQFSYEPPKPFVNDKEPPIASPATGRAASPPTSLEVVDSPALSSSITNTITPNNYSSFNRSPSPEAVPLQRSTDSERASTAKKQEAPTVVSSSSSLPKVPEPSPALSGTQTEVKPPSSGPLHTQAQPSSMEPKPPAVSRVSSSLPKTYQRSDSARLTSVVTPRPFGSQSSRITSLPRGFIPAQTDDSHKRVNGNVDVSKKSSVPSRYHQFMTSEDEAQSSSAHSSEEEEEEATTGNSVNSAQSVTPVPPQVKSEPPAPAKETSQENYCEMRISLNQKPNSSRDFGFQAAWDSTGACVTSIQPGSPAEMCQLQTGDKVLTVNGHKVADMSYTEWKSHMDEALQEGSLVMDIRRHGQNNWDRVQPSLPFKSHKTINLTSTDHPMLVGSQEKSTISSSLDFTSNTPAETLTFKETPAHPVSEVASNGVNGGFREEPVTMRKKESEPISLKNLKRRSEFFEQGGSGSSVSALVYLCGGGSEPAVPDIPVPVITPSSRWSFDPEEERKRQEKWQKEQERLLQEKYKRDQEKLQEEWLKAQQAISTSTVPKQLGSLEVNNHSNSSTGPHSPLSPVNQPTSLLWEEEERKRKEEQERQRQAEEKRKREEEERELLRLQEQRMRKERQEQEERKRREDERRLLEAEELQRREKERAFEQQQQWTKSKSSPQLDEEDRPQRKGVHVPPGGMAQRLLEEQLKKAHDRVYQSQKAASELELERRNILHAMRYREPERVTSSGAAEKKDQQPASQAELERQQILNEMKKKTSLLTDNSWIRQRSPDTSTNKERDLPPMRRGDSLDNLDTSYNSWRSSSKPRSGSFAQNYFRPHSALSGSTSFYGGGPRAQRYGSTSTLPSSYSMGSLRSGAGSHLVPWSRQSPSPSPSPSSPSPINSPEPTAEADAPQQHSRSVSGKKICTFCETPLGKGAAMIIESLGLCYHLGCFKCIDCKSDLGGSEAGAEVRIRNKQLYCNSCYMRVKTGQPTSM